MKFDSSIDLTFTRKIAAPRTLLWECWTTPEHVKNFFVPKPHHVVDCQIELRTGGRFNTTFKIEGKEMRNEGVCLEIVEGHRLVFTNVYTEGWRPAADPFMTAIVEFEDHPDGGTIYTVTVRHSSEDARKRHEEMGFYNGWGTAATQLEEYAKSLQAKGASAS